MMDLYYNLVFADSKGIEFCTNSVLFKAPASVGDVIFTESYEIEIIKVLHFINDIPTLVCKIVWPD